MGKSLQAPFLNVNQRIIKRVKKYDKKDTCKRKSSIDIGEPLHKIQKLHKADKKQGYFNAHKEVCNETVYTDTLLDTNHVVLKTKEQMSYDLFLGDELKHNYSAFTFKDFYFHILDEIALEGLDGITVEAFWKRLGIALDGPCCIDKNIENFIWQQIIQKTNSLQFFELPEARNELEIYNPFDFMHADIGVVMEVAYELPDIYPVAPVNSPSTLGSCSTFNERENISEDIKDLTLDEVKEKYGRKLVIVADQKQRIKALCGNLIDPCIDFLNAEYCILERIGRSRRLGELTQGNVSISRAFKMDPKTLFHYKKELYCSDLISKQYFVIKSAVLDQNKSGSLLHLRRFYSSVRSRTSCVANQIINVLKSQPGYKISSRKLSTIFADNIQPVRKLLKSPEFKKFVKLKIYPYRSCYPNAKSSEYLRKSNRQEKSIVVYELVNPYINVAACWKIDDREDSDAEDDEEELSGSKIYNADMLRDIYYRIHSTGEKGCSSLDIRKLVGIDKNTLRMALKKLVQKNVIDFNKFDEGKQRKFVYKTKSVKPEQSASNNSVDVTPTVKMSSIKAKMIERQKAALARKKQENLQNNKPQTNSQEVEIVANIFLHIEKPQYIDCRFLINREIDLTEPRSKIPLLNIELIKRYSINLTYISLNHNYLFNINDILNDIVSCVRSPEVKTNFTEFYVKKYNFDINIKRLLLRAALGEKEVLQQLSNSKPDGEKTAFPDLVPTRNSSWFADKLNYMGENPTLVFQEEDRGVKTEFLLSTTPPEYNLAIPYLVTDHSFTERVLQRINIILNLVNAMGVIVDIFTLLKLMVDEETKLDIKGKIDRKSLLRILKRLVAEGYIKIYKVTLNNTTITKTVNFICHPTINYDCDDIQTACQQIKWKNFLSVAKKNVKPHVPSLQKKIEEKFSSSPFSKTDVMNSINEMKLLNKTMIKELNRKFNNKIGRVYGAKPKFTRMRIMHEFLFYVIYDCHPPLTYERPMENDQIETLFKSYRIGISEKDLEELPKIYRHEISWKMFIPPLPVHSDWPAGWALMCDIILRLPVCVLLKIHSCSFEDNDLLEMLNHPIKRFYLVKDLSEKIRKTILFKRKYLQNIYDTINRLVFCGLIQFGPQKSKEKDQMFIYVNRRASLWDTTSSEPGYNEIEKKIYPTIPFYFGSPADIEEYWQQLSTISMNTKLGTREAGKLVTLSYINTKPQLVECIKSRSPMEALDYDNGIIPGDQKGAAGLDSAMWTHLVKNWYYTKGNSGNSLYSDFKDDSLKKVPSQLISFKELQTKNVKYYLPQIPQVEEKHGKKYVLIKNSRKGTIKRTIQKRRTKDNKREYNDSIDRKIIKKLQGTKVKWSKAEDDILYLAKVIDIFLNSDKVYRRQIVPLTLIRDILHRVSPESKYKTSRSIQRRWNKRSFRGLYKVLEENCMNLLKIKPINDTFGQLISRLGTQDQKTKKIFRLSEDQLCSAYVILASYIMKNRKKVHDVLQGNLIAEDYLSKENLVTTENSLIDANKDNKKYYDPKTPDDIRRDVLKSVIHSSLCCKDGSLSLTHSVLRIYQNYTDALLREAVQELRETNTITCRKWKDRKTKIWETPFALSQYYVFYQYCTFSKKTAQEAFATLFSIIRDKGKHFDVEEQMAKKRYGELLGVNELFSFNNAITFVFYLPHNTVILNPEIENHDELANELALRYQLILKSLQNLSNENEIDLEDENDTFRSKTIQELEEDNQVDDSGEQRQDLQDTQSNLDLAIDSGNNETIDRLKTWITDRVQTDIERRSPSPEFMDKEVLPAYIDPYSDFGKATSSTQDKGELRKTSYSERASKQIPTVEEIKEGMLKLTTNNEERNIPYITELSHLLKENFSELKTTADLIRLKNHFITEYIKLNEITIDDDDFEKLKGHSIIKELEESKRYNNFWSKIENNIIVRDFLRMPKFEQLILNDGGNEHDIALASDIIQFASSNTFFGVTGAELKENFLHREENCSLVNIIKILIKAGILLQTGTCTLTFVHYSYQYIWVVEQNLSSGSYSLNTEKADERKALSSMIIMPWVRVDGTLNRVMLKTWTCNVLSYCLDYPKVPFSKICDKFCYIKPVDLYFIVQILEEIGCIEVLIYETEEKSIFSEWRKTCERPATFLDNIEDLIIQPNNVSMTRLGSFYNEE
uniref:General transcription factor 3C polypeptide 1 n=1 Tax=Diabrotica virgifera virgifera TaxID=50390 RepID=A0A6P7FFU9_DIAVI